MNRKRTITAMMISGALALAPLASCEQLPGGEKEQGAAIGGVSGAAAGAVVAKNNRALGALIGGLLGAGGGYLIGSEVEKADADEQDKQQAREAVQQAQNDPATAAEANQAETADINGDGFVTLDEVIAMDRAGFAEDEMIRRLEATDQVFELSDRQQQHLIDQGVDRRVVNRMQTINENQRQQLLENNPPPDNVIGRPPGENNTDDNRDNRSP